LSYTATHPLGRSKRFLLGVGTIVPVEDADDDESSADVDGKRDPFSSSSSLSSNVKGGSGGSFDRWCFAKERCRSLMFQAVV